MNIVLVCPYRLDDNGGVSVMVTRLQESLRKLGHRAVVLEAGETARVVRSDAGGDDRYAVYLRRVWHPRARIRGFVSFLAFLPVSMWALWRFLRRENVQIVHLHFAMPRSLYFAAMRLVAPWKVVVTFHGSDGYSLGGRSRAYRWLVGGAVSCADLVTAVSDDLLDVVAGWYPTIRAKSRVIRNGNSIPSAARRIQSGAGTMWSTAPEGYVLAVGSLIRRKGYDVLLRAVRLVREAGHDLRVVVVGGGPEAGNLKNLADELGLRHVVSFAGEVPHLAMGAVFEGARFFVHAAREESFGMAIVEAMAYRKAVVATRVGGICEFVTDGETGLLVPPDDPNALADAVIRLEKDEALRDALAARGHALATTQYRWERVVEDYLREYGVLCTAG